ncbi:hypothetical protein [Streptomyces sp. Y7]|uniref:hypothetical protein n=1 Tax=Streptomyces sp. Y7 TaxID=3342392 RepID=UPI00370FD039
MLPPSAIAGVSVVCALAPWVFTEPMALRGLAAVAAATAVVGAVVMRRWDTQAGKQVADLTRARASDEWRHEERVAELETDLEESRELRVKLEQRLRGKRAELAGLRNEHASLLRRYATAETERASVLEERRVLEIEATTPARALPPVPGDRAAEAADDDTVTESAETAESAEEAGAVAAPADADDAEFAVDDEAAEDAEVTEEAEVSEEAPADARVFSPEGSRLFLRAKAALARFDEDGEPAKGEAAAEDENEDENEGASDGGGAREASDESSPEETSAESADSVESEVTAASVASPEDASQSPVGGEAAEDEQVSDRSALDQAVEDAAAKRLSSKRKPSSEGPKNDPPKGDGPSGGRPLKDASGDAEVEGAGGSETEPALEDDPQGKPGAVDGHEHAAAVTPAGAVAATRPALPATLPAARRPAGHFIEPTAVAVAPAAPVRRPSVEGGFDFFGTKQDAESALETVQNEDLADVVGQEALALHKAESEAEFKPAGEESRGIGQVIDLTAHDETEQIDVQGLRSAVS